MAFGQTMVEDAPMGLFTRSKTETKPDTTPVERLVPIPRADWRRTDDGGVEILELRYRTGPLARWLQPRLKGDKRFVIWRLDARGAVVWTALDGRRSISQLERVYLDAFPDDRQQAMHRVWLFLQAAAQRGMVGFRCPDRARSDSEYNDV